MNVSPRTAELARAAMDVALRRTRRNGRVMPPDIVQALYELEAAATVSPERQEWTAPLPVPGEWLLVKDAARCLHVSPRTVERRAAAGLLPARRVGRSWIIWNEKGTPMAERTTEATQAGAPPRYCVTGPYITVRTGGMALTGIGNRNGYLIIGLYKGAILPADVPDETIASHLEQGLIAAVAA